MLHPLCPLSAILSALLLTDFSPLTHFAKMEEALSALLCTLLPQNLLLPFTVSEVVRSPSELLVETIYYMARMLEASMQSAWDQNNIFFTALSAMNDGPRSVHEWIRRPVPVEIEKWNRSFDPIRKLFKLYKESDIDCSSLPIEVRRVMSREYTLNQMRHMYEANTKLGAEDRWDDNKEGGAKPRPLRKKKEKKETKDDVVVVDADDKKRLKFIRPPNMPSYDVIGPFRLFCDTVKKQVEQNYSYFNTNARRKIYQHAWENLAEEVKQQFVVAYTDQIKQKEAAKQAYVAAKAREQNSMSGATGAANIGIGSRTTLVGSKAAAAGAQGVQPLGPSVNTVPYTMSLVAAGSQRDMVDATLSLEQLAQAYLPAPLLQTAPLPMEVLATAGEEEARIRAYAFFKASYVDKLKSAMPLQAHKPMDVASIETVLQQAWISIPQEKKEQYLQMGRESLQTVQVMMDALSQSIQSLCESLSQSAFSSDSDSSLLVPAVPGYKAQTTAAYISELELIIPSTNHSGGWEYQDWHHKMDLEPSMRDKMRASVVKSLSVALIEIKEFNWASPQEFEEKMLKLEMFLYFDAKSQKVYEDMDALRLKLRAMVRAKTHKV